MATATNVLSTQNQSITNYDYSKLFLTNFKVITVNVVATGGDLELTPGVLMGRISATSKGAVLKSASNDGSQYPLGICLETISITENDNADVQVAVTGAVDETKIIFDGTDTLATAVDGRILRDRIPADTEGIRLETLTELVNNDNQ